MKYCFGISVIFIFFHLNLNGQPLRFYPYKSNDSLLKIVDTTTGTHRAYVLLEIAHTIYANKKDFDLSKPHIEEAIAIADSLIDHQSLVNAYYLLAMYYRFLGDTSNSQKFLLMANHHLTFIDDWKGSYKVWLLLFRHYDEIEKYDSALLYLDRIQERITGKDQWFCRLIAMKWKAYLYDVLHEHEKELLIEEKLLDSVIHYYRPNPYYEGVVFLRLSTNLGGIYSRHGFYQSSVKTNFRLLKSIHRFDLSELDALYYKGKCYGSTAFAYEHWGRYDSSLYFHELSEVYFDSVIEKYGDAVDYIINVANQIEGKAIVYMKMGNYQEAELNFARSLEMREKKNDHLGVAMCYDGLAELNYLQGRYSKAQSLFQKALDMKDEYREDLRKNYLKTALSKRNKVIQQSEAVSYLKLGNLYLDWNNPDLALLQYEKSLALSREIASASGIAKALTALGDAYTVIDPSYHNPIHYMEAMDFYNQIGNRHGQGEIFKKLGDYFKKQNMVGEAIVHYLRAQEILEDLEMQRDLAELYFGLGEAYLKNKQKELAENFFNESLKIAELLGLQKLKMDDYKVLSDLYTQKNQVDSAFAYYKKYTFQKDSVFTLEAYKMIAEVKEQFETERKDGEIELLKSQSALQELKLERTQYVLISLGGLALLLIISAVLFIRQERLKLGQKNIILQQKLLRTQMNPHFIFNALTNIQSFMVAKKVDQATGYLTRFSRLLRDILTNSREEQIRLEKEINTIENYLSLQQLRFSNKFDYEIDVHGDLETEEIMIPPMLAQPFIENAIEHGIRHKEERGHIRVSFEQINHHLQLEVQDDGVGRVKAKELETDESLDHLSMATSITTERIEFLRRRYRKKIKMEIIDLFDKNGNACGTKVHFIIPFF